MRKLISVSLLVLALSCSAYAGDIPNLFTGEIPNIVTGNIPNDGMNTENILTGVALVLQSVRSLF